MIDLENELIESTLDEIKFTIEKQIIDSFEIKVEPLHGGKVHEGNYEVQISYICKGEKIFESIKGACFSALAQIKEADYKKWVKEG